MRDPPLVPLVVRLGSDAEIWLSLPTGREFWGMPIPIPGSSRDADAERGHRSLLLAFPGLGGGREQQYRYREIIERAE